VPNPDITIRNFFIHRVGELAAAREELSSLRTANKSLDSVSHSTEKQLTQATIETAALKTQVCTNLVVTAHLVILQQEPGQREP
jgi:hypothetical protein